MHGHRNLKYITMYNTCLIALDNMQTAVTAMFRGTLSDLQPCHLTEQRVKFSENVSVVVGKEPEYLPRQSVPSLHAVLTYLLTHSLHGAESFLSS